MSQQAVHALKSLGSVIHQFNLDSLLPALRACEALSCHDALLDVAVPGQFKSGKSSLLNALVGDNLFPVSVLPATAVITRPLGQLTDAIVLEDCCELFYVAIRHRCAQRGIFVLHGTDMMSVKLRAVSRARSPEVASKSLTRCQ